MGYTHHFHQTRDFTPDEWAALQADAGRLAKAAAAAGTPLRDGLGRAGTAPEIDDGVIRFNGDSELGQDYETFELNRQRSADKAGFCKTARQAYDAAVVAVLCLADLRAPGALHIRSEGGAVAWTAGLELARRAAPRARLPKAIAG